MAFLRGIAAVGAESTKPAEMLPATQIEYLISRPVAARVLEKVQAQFETTPPGEGWRRDFAEAFKEVMGYIWVAYNTLNSGEFVEPDPHERAITKLLKGIDLETVENSFVLEIEVTLPRNAEATALVANALAQAYIERVQEQTAHAATSLIDYLETEIAARESEYTELEKREFELRQNAGILSLEQERDALLAARDVEQERLLEIRIEREELEAKLKAYAEDRADLIRRGTLALVEQEIALSGAQLPALDRRESLRVQSIERIIMALAGLNEREYPLLNIQKALSRIEEEINDLKNRKIVLSLSKSAGLTQLRVVNPAVTPDYPSFPEIVINTIVALVAAIFVVLFVIIGADTLSGSVKTSVDLRRLAGNRGLGPLSNRLLRRFDGKGAIGKRDRLIARMRRFGRGIGPRMAALGFFEPGTIAVTGFGSPESVAAASLALAGAIGSTGKRINWKPFGDWRPGRSDLLGRIGVSEYGAAKNDGEDQQDRQPDDPPVLVECIGPVSSGFSWQNIVDRPITLICVISSGELAEDDIVGFQNEAEKRGIGTTAYLLIAS